MHNKTALIVGAGPAGLTAALELLRRTDITPIIVERDNIVGGLSRTVNYKGNRLDIGGHRFFSKSARVTAWWSDILPTVDSDNSNQQSIDQVMLVRKRRSRIYYNHKLFDYPITFNWVTVRQLGFKAVIGIGASYLKARLFPITPEKNLEDFFVNRFGRRLYKTFFQTYTEKVWGKPSQQIDARWGAQRIKGLSFRKVIQQAIRQRFKRKPGVASRAGETSLIEQFLYPKFGPGQMWETVAAEVKKRGGQLLLQNKVIGFNCHANKVTSATVQDASGNVQEINADIFFSTMPVDDLVKAFGNNAPSDIATIAAGLQFRDFMTIGLLVKKFLPIDDNWIYIHEPGVKLGRLQIFNNWSEAMVADSDTVWLGLEYFCSVGDELWQMSDKALLAFATQELQQLDFIEPNTVIDGTVQRVAKAYPAYFGTYDRFNEIRQWTEQFSNLFLLGRNGMHHYNNQDHSMLTALTAVDNIQAGIESKANIWTTNTEAAYHEAKSA